MDKPHPDHLVGYGKDMVTWPNDDFRPLTPSVPKNKLADLARRTREFNA